MRYAHDREQSASLPLRVSVILLQDSILGGLMIWGALKLLGVHPLQGLVPGTPSRESRHSARQHVVGSAELATSPRGCPSKGHEARAVSPNARAAPPRPFVVLVRV